MKIYESAVRKPISTILLFVGVMVFGLFSLMNLAVDQYPEIEIPQISVITMYPGANAADIETNITRVLEDNLNTVSNLKKLTSKSQDNVSMITVEFEYGSDLNEGANEIRDVVSRVQSQLPDDIDYPTIFKFSTSMIPVMMLAVTAEESYPALNKILDDKLVNVLNRVDGVGAVSIIGAPEREVQVNVDPAKLEAYNLTVEQLGQIIAAENVNIPSGTIDVGNNTFNIKADGEFKLSDEMRKVVVSNAGGRTVRLSDVAQIRDTLEKATMDERVNGQRGVRVMFQKQSGANTVNIVHEIQSRLPEIQKTLPKDVKMELIFEGSQEITDAIGSLSETILYAFIFVVLVVMAFLGRWRATLIICMTIPVSLICSFIYLFATGSTLNIISLSSLSIAIGMVVDDAIVVLENITTHIERENRQRVISVQSTLGAGVALGDVVAEVEKLLADYPAPDGVDLEVGGTVEDQGDAFGDLGTLLILIVILVYIVMATQFESLKFPFIIMFTIPFAFTGVFLALWMTSTPLSLIALIGAIMLVGIVTKNGIVMVDYMNLLIERGSGVFDAVIAGGKSRLRPVLMTSFTTILGMLPLAIGTGAGSETWQPMGIAVIGGLTFSTILTLFIVPVLYSILVNRSQRKEREKLARLSAEHQASKH